MACSNAKCFDLRLTLISSTLVWMKLRYLDHRFTSQKTAESTTKSFCWQFITFSNESRAFHRWESSRPDWTFASFWSILAFSSLASIPTTSRWASSSEHFCISAARMAATTAFVELKPSFFDYNATQTFRDSSNKLRVCRRNIYATWFTTPHFTSWSNSSTLSWDSVSIQARCCHLWVSSFSLKSPPLRPLKSSPLNGQHHQNFWWSHDVSQRMICRMQVNNLFANWKT